MRWNAMVLGTILAGVLSAADARAQEDSGEQDEFVDEVAEGLDAMESEDDADYRAETVLITQEKIAKIGGAAHRVDEEELDRQDYSNAEAVTQQVPGVFARGEDGYGLRPNIGVRGANSERSKKLALMEDGVLFGPAPYSAPAAYYFPMMSRMVGMEIFKGPGAVKFGPNTIGGALNLVTREIPYSFQGGIDLSAGSYEGGKAHIHAGNSNDWGGFLVEGIHQQSGGFKELDGGGDTGFNRQEFMLKGALNSDYSAPVFQRLQVKLGWSRENSNETYLGLAPQDFEENPFRRYGASALDEMNWVRAQVELRHRVDWGEHLSLESVAYRHDLTRDWFKVNALVEGTPIFDVLNDPTGRRSVLYDILAGNSDSLSSDENLLIGNNRRIFVSQGVQSTLVHRATGQGWANRVETGLRLHHDAIERHHSQAEFAMVSGRPQRQEAPQQTAENTGKTLAIAAFVLEQFSWSRLTVAPGVRLEHYRQSLTNHVTDDVVENDDTVVVPGLGLNVEVVEHLSALAGVHRGFSPTAPGQQGVEAETSINYEAGLRYSDARQERLLEVVGFFNDYDNLVGDCTFSAGCDESALDKQFNAGDADVFGLELAGHWTFALPAGLSLKTRAAYTFTHGEFKSDFVSDNPQYGRVEAGDQLPYVPQHQVSAGLGLDHTKFSVNVAGTYVGQMREEASQEDDALMTDAQTMLDATASWYFLPGWTAYTKAENILSNEGIASRRPFGARPFRPRVLGVGAKYEWN